MIKGFQETVFLVHDKVTRCSFHHLFSPYYTLVYLIGCRLTQNCNCLLCVIKEDVVSSLRKNVISISDMLRRGCRQAVWLDEFDLFLLRIRQGTRSEELYFYAFLFNLNVCLWCNLMPAWDILCKFVQSSWVPLCILSR